MQKQEAITIIENTFSAAFDEANFTLFVKNLLNDLDTTKYNHYAGNLIKDAYRKHVKQYKRIGKYTDPNGDAMDVLIVEVTDQYHLDHARTSLRNFVITHLDSFEKDYALVAFYSHSDGGADWRFSFVKLEYKTKVNEGKIKQEKELTPAKRYSFLVGEHEKAHTAKKQLLPLLENIYNNPTIEELEGAFSIEAVTDEFFEQYKTLFVSLTEQFEQNHKLKTELAAAGIEIPRFTKKLLGQIVFLYFLQKKGWMGVPKDQKWGTGEKRFLQKLFDEAIEKGKNFFGDFLQYLFYEALAHKHNDEGVQGYFAKLNCKVPFLNGGLFEADYDWANDHITIPNELFRNEDKIGKNGDIGSGVLDVFDRYNFTIKEDEPLEKEVAVDPEMLGKVFENMLEVTERKSKGAFYTPREIVHYMCQESLIHYLDNAVNTYSKTYQELGNSQIKMFGNEVKKDQQSIMFEKESIRIPKEDIEIFIRKGFFTLENDQRVIRVGKETVSYHFQLPETIRNHAELLDQKLSEIRVCDPAIGSGAFPVGMLHEIVNARLVLRPHFKNKGNHINQTNQDLSRSIGSSDYAYYLKRHTIQECIYGVDIDASAIDIARLRLWLSLVVDEEDLDTIEALPNLDYKIVCGNSLIGIPQGVTYNIDIEKELEILKDQFFTETDETSKKELRTVINSKIQEQFDFLEPIIGYKIDFDFKLFFSEVWHEKGGFDVVIGNPPYGADLTEAEKNILKRRFDHIVERIRNSFLYFIGISEGLINKTGIVDLIIPNEFLFQIYMSKARKHYLVKNRMLKAINIGENAFDAIVPTCIIMFDRKIENDYIIEVCDFRNNSLKEIEHQLSIGILETLESRLLLNTPKYTFSFNQGKTKIINQITTKGNPFENYCIDIANGISTGCDSIYVVSEDLVRERNFEKEFVKPTIKGKDFNKYTTPQKPPRYILYINTSFRFEKAPNITAYLEENKEFLISKSVEKKSGTRDWYILFRSRNEELFTNIPKLLIRQTGDSIIASADKNVGYYCIDSVNVAQIKPNYKEHVGLFLAILNSDLIKFYYHEISQEEGRVLAQVKPTRIKCLPILIESGYSSIMNILALYMENVSILSSKLASSFIEDLINSLVFELYFPNEIKSANKEILKHLFDLKPITDDMSDELKLAIIQSEFARLYDPNHPVRNNVETLDSVEEVRIIREALK